MKKRIMAIAVILFSFLYLPAHSQCSENKQGSGTETVQGIVNQNNNFYRNLIVQDIAFAEQFTFDQVIIRFDYNVNFKVDQCTDNLLEIRVSPVFARSFPMIYRQVDISDAVLPEKVDLIFHITNEMGILTDSVTFLDVRVNQDSSLYVMKSIPRNGDDGNLDVGFYRAYFHFTRRSYEVFRDRIMEIDRYYAASALADSALAWTGNGFLEETDDLDRLIVRQFELEWLIRNILPVMNAYLSVEEVDQAGLQTRISRLARLNTRYRTIIYQQSLKSNPTTLVAMRSLLDTFLSRLDYYDQMAYSGDFRNVAFIERMSSPVLTNGFIHFLAEHIVKEHGADRNDLPLIGSMVSGVFTARARQMTAVSDQLRALAYFESAYKIALFSSAFPGKDSLSSEMCGLKKEVVNSYLGISRKAFNADNPSMAANYLREALNLLDNDGYSRCGAQTAYDHEKWLFDGMLVKAKELIDQKQFRKAITYLEEVSAGCDANPRYPYPDEMADLYGRARQGIYAELVARAATLWQQEDFEEAELLLGQAINLRMASGYSIPRSQSEGRLEVAIDRKHYEEAIDLGTRNLNWKEYNIALYYFNRATIYEHSISPYPDPKLQVLRQTAARQVISRMMLDARAKAILYDFDGYEASLAKISLLIDQYGFPGTDTLLVEYHRMRSDASVSLCNKARAEYNSLLASTFEAKQQGDYILARKRAQETVDYSLDHLSCGIHDTEAWYQKVILEPLATFQEKEKGMSIYGGVSAKEYLEKYRDLRSYYYKTHLLDQGVILKPFYEYVMLSEDAAFLKDMTGYYIQQKKMDKALEILKKLEKLGVDQNEVTREQQSLAQLFAIRDVSRNSGQEPWTILDSYVGKDEWFREFRKSYGKTWMKETGGKIRYWPFIWKK